MDACDCLCCRCGERAVVFYPLLDVDIASRPYCAACYYDAMLELADALYRDDVGMLLCARYAAKEKARRYGWVEE